MSISSYWIGNPYRSSIHDSKHFRIVRIEPGRWHDPLRCGLGQCKLGDDFSEKRSYKALSYVWGSSGVTEAIHLEGIPFHITLNLSCALRHLRKVDQETLLWVDTLCINQQDHKERKLQVGIMHLIYKNAEEVVVFMGDGRSHRVSYAHLTEPPPSPKINLHGHESDNSFVTEMLTTCRSSGTRKLASTLTAAACAMGLISLFSKQDGVEKGLLELMTLKERTRRYLFECLRAFVVSPWWSRIWVVQEIAVGTAVTIHYGTITSSWKSLVTTAEVWSLPKTKQLAMSTGVEPENIKVFTLFAKQLVSLEQTRRKWRSEGGSNNLVRLLQEFSDRQASDDRDKVYALLNLVEKEQQYIEPDYRLDVLGTYRATALALIGKGGSLACWAGDQKRKFNKGLPSWIPDWSTAVEAGDKRRMDAYDSYNANCGWTLRIIESERDYWSAVEDHMGLLMDSPATKAGTLPASLSPFVHDYIDLLMQRATSLQSFRINADELKYPGLEHLTSDGFDKATLDSTLSHLKWCKHHQIFPRSGVKLLQRWMSFLENSGIDRSMSPRPFYEVDRGVRIRQSLRELDAATKDEDLEVGKYDAKCAVDELESIVLGPNTILGMEILSAIEGVISRIRQLPSLCKAGDNKIAPEKLFQVSCSLLGSASWLTEHHFKETKSQNWDKGLEPCKKAKAPERVLALQTSPVDGVALCGPRHLGWADTESALHTLITWFQFSCTALSDAETQMGPSLLSFGLSRQFIKTIVGGICLCGDSYLEANDSALEPLEEWLRQCLNIIEKKQWVQVQESLDIGSYALPRPPSPFFEDIQVATDGRVFFVTEKGSMGLGPASIQKGDTIHILPSGRAHFVLRPKPSEIAPPDSNHPEWMKALNSDRYELIGDCYLHTDGTPDNGATAAAGPAVQGSLPFEFLGARYLETRELRTRKTVLLI